MARDIELDVDIQGVARETKKVSDNTFVLLLEPVRRSLLVVGICQVCLVRSPLPRSRCHFFSRAPSQIILATSFFAFFNVLSNALALFSGIILVNTFKRDKVMISFLQGKINQRAMCAPRRARHIGVAIVFTALVEFFVSMIAMWQLATPTALNKPQFTIFGALCGPASSANVSFWASRSLQIYIGIAVFMTAVGPVLHVLLASIVMTVYSSLASVLPGDKDITSSLNRAVVTIAAMAATNAAAEAVGAAPPTAREIAGHIKRRESVVVMAKGDDLEAAFRRHNSALTRRSSVQDSSGTARSDAPQQFGATARSAAGNTPADARQQNLVGLAPVADPDEDDDTTLHPFVVDDMSVGGGGGGGGGSARTRAADLLSVGPRVKPSSSHEQKGSPLQAPYPGPSNDAIQGGGGGGGAIAGLLRRASAIAMQAGPAASAATSPNLGNALDDGSYVGVVHSNTTGDAANLGAGPGGGRRGSFLGASQAQQPQMREADSWTSGGSHSQQQPQQQMAGRRASFLQNAASAMAAAAPPPASYHGGGDGASPAVQPGATAAMRRASFMAMAAGGAVSASPAAYSEQPQQQPQPQAPPGPAPAGAYRRASFMAGQAPGTSPYAEAPPQQQQQQGASAAMRRASFIAAATASTMPLSAPAMSTSEYGGAGGYQPAGAGPRRSSVGGIPRYPLADTSPVASPSAGDWVGAAARAPGARRSSVPLPGSMTPSPDAGVGMRSMARNSSSYGQAGGSPQTFGNTLNRMGSSAWQDASNYQ